MGGMLQFFLNFEEAGPTAAAKSNAVSYFVFIVVMLGGSLIAAVFVIPDPCNGGVVREDGEGARLLERRVLAVTVDDGRRAGDLQDVSSTCMQAQREPWALIPA